MTNLKRYSGPTLEWAATGARADSNRYRTCIAITHEQNEGYGWCPLDAFFLLHGPMAKVGLAKVVDLVGTQYPTMANKQSVMRDYGKVTQAQLDAAKEAKAEWDDEHGQDLDAGQRQAMAGLADD